MRESSADAVSDLTGSDLAENDAAENDADGIGGDPLSSGELGVSKSDALAEGSLASSEDGSASASDSTSDSDSTSNSDSTDGASAAGASDLTSKDDAGTAAADGAMTSGGIGASADGSATVDAAESATEGDSAGNATAGSTDIAGNATAGSTASTSTTTTAAGAGATTTTTTQNTKPTSVSAPVIKTGWYNITSRLNSSYSLCVKNLSTKNGAKLQLKKGKGSYGTAFLVKREGSYYRIYVGISTDKLLEVKSSKKGSLIVDIRSKRSKATLFKLSYDESLGAYQLVNVATNYAIGVSGGVAKDKANIVARKRKAGAASQAFYFSGRAGLVLGNIYEISTKQKGKRALSAQGSKGKFKSYTSDASQKWQISPVAGKRNVYTIESIASGKLLIGVKNKTVRVARSSAGNAAAWWKATYKNSGIVWTNYRTKKPLSTAGKKCVEGSSAMNKKQKSSSSRVFTLKTVPVLESGIYELQSNANAGYVVAVPNSSKTSGDAIQLKASNSGNNQKWRYDATTQTFTNINSGLVMTADASSVGAGVMQSAATGAATQKWRVEYAGGGKYRLVSYANKNLVLSGDAASDGAALQLRVNTGSKLQKFNVAKSSVTYAPKGFKLIKSIVNWGHGSLSASYIVIHETANPGATAKNHRDLWSRSGYYADYAVHYTLDWTGDCYYCVPENRLCWQVGGGNKYVVGIELCHATNKSDFNKVWNAGVQWAAWQLKKNGWGVDRLLSHNDCRKKWGGTDHTDPDGYFSSYGKSWKQFKSAVSAALASY